MHGTAPASEHVLCGFFRVICLHPHRKPCFLPPWLGRPQSLKLYLHRRAQTHGRIMGSIGPSETISKDSLAQRTTHNLALTRIAMHFESPAAWLWLALGLYRLHRLRAVFFIWRSTQRLDTALANTAQNRSAKRLAKKRFNVSRYRLLRFAFSALHWHRTGFGVFGGTAPHRRHAEPETEPSTAEPSWATPPYFDGHVWFYMLRTLSPACIRMCRATCKTLHREVCNAQQRRCVHSIAGRRALVWIRHMGMDIFAQLAPPLSFNPVQCEVWFLD